MLKAQDSQFKIMEDGKIFYQDNPTNPLPGNAFAYLVKGDSVLKPKVVMLEAEALKGQDVVAVREYVQEWLVRHLSSVLEPLVALENTEALKGPARGIAFQVHEAMGIVPRESIEDLISTLDQDDRRDLRAKKVRLGPILVFIPALNKPAAVRLRGLLWGLYHERALPMECPKDGIVSFVIDPAKADAAFYQSVGYPVFGTRAIRIDMLDRVISAIYDSAKDGKFQAQHTMAEWLGCSIAGLYEVLEAMGHKKVFDPAEQPVVEVAASDVVPVADVAPVEAVEAAKPAVVAKPDLATFRLKKGKAFEKPVHADRKPFVKRPEKSSGEKPKDFKKSFKSKDKARKIPEREERVMQAGPAPKLEDSPFAILSQLKKKSDG